MNSIRRRPCRRPPAATGQPDCRMRRVMANFFACAGALHSRGGVGQPPQAGRHRISPQLDHRVAAPWPPRFGARGSAFAPSREPSSGPRVAAPGLRPGTRPDGRLRAARCISRSTARCRAARPSARRNLRAFAPAEIDPAVDHCPRHRAHRLGTRAGHADRREVGIGQGLRCREHMFQSGRECDRQRLPEALRQAGRDRAGRGDADLLAEDRAHRDLEAVPAAGKAQPGRSAPRARNRGVCDNASAIACGSASRSNIRRSRLTIRSIASAPRHAVRAAAHVRPRGQALAHAASRS